MQRTRLVLGGPSFVALALMSILASACASDAGQEPNTQPCFGGKCDSSNETSVSLVEAVLGCDQRRDKQVETASSTAEKARAEVQFGDCVLSANNASVAAIAMNLSNERTRRSNEEIANVLEEFRFASLCSDVSMATSVRGDLQDLLFTSCEARRERTMAGAIGAIVDFRGLDSQWDLPDGRESFSQCYTLYDLLLVVAPTPELVLAAKETLVTCAATLLRAQALPLSNSRCEQSSCADPFLTLSYVMAGVETSISTSDRACQLFVDASAGGREMAAERLLDCKVSVYSDLAIQVAKGLQ